MKRIIKGIATLAFEIPVTLVLVTYVFAKERWRESREIKKQIIAKYPIPEL